MGRHLNRLIKSTLLVAGLSLILAGPVYGEGTKVNANKAGTYETRTDTSYTPGTGIYGTDGPAPYYDGTNRMYTYNNNGVMNGTGRYGVNNVTGTKYRTTAADRANGNWGWLGLLGLIGLAGMRGRNPEKQH